MKRKTYLLITAVAILASYGPGNLQGQSYSPLYAPQSSNTGNWVCLDQNHKPIPSVYWRLSNGVYFYSNAHYHGPESSEPVSSSSPNEGYADSSGNFSNTITTTLVGQEEYQTGTCSNSAGSTTTTFNFAVGYGDVYYADVPSVWVKIGGSDTGGGTNHGTTAYNRYLQTSAGNGLYAATQDYIRQNPSVQKICTNDMALYVGGKFDICNASGLCSKNGVPVVAPWSSPHSQHDRGTAADVAAVGTAQCTNAGGSGVNVAQFIQDCVNHGAVAAYSFNEGNHAHCGFSVPTFPH